MKADRTFGFFLERSNRYGSEHVTARVVSREGEAGHPLGVGFSYEWPNGLHLDGLGIDGFVSDRQEADYIGHAPEYRELYATGVCEVERMARTLKRIWRRIEKDGSREPGDMLLSMAKALGLSFMVVATSERPGSAWSDQEYRWLSLGEGRNEFRALIEAAKSDVRAKHPVAA